MKTLNQTNIKSVNSCRSIINITDILIDDVKNQYEFVNRSFNYTINYLLDSFSIIKFDDVKNIVKYFNLKRFEVVVSLLTDLQKRCKETIKSYYM